jgi:agmatine deiminase
MAGAACATAMGELNVQANEKVPYETTGASLVDGAPRDAGFRFPAEWHLHERTIMQFPPPQNWPASHLRGAQPEWAETANVIAEFEPVTMVVDPQSRAIAEPLLSSAVEIVELPLNDGWSRDSGPMVLTNGSGERRVAGFSFNSWGAKYRPYDDDALLKGRLANHLGMALHPSDLVLEGGAVHVDGEGTLITTEQCLLNANRNPGWSKVEVEDALRGWLGVETIIWLPKGLEPDPITDGHVDGIAAFAAPGTVLLHMTDDRNDPNHAITQQASEILQNTPDARGRQIEVIEIPMTSWDVLHMNFYICNGAVVVPVAGNAEEDDLPLGIIAEIFPGRTVVPVGGRYIAKGGGGIHCITQQVPTV